jgi:hypothetical protein
MSTAAANVGVGRKALWFGLLGGAVAWTVHLLFAYVVAEFGCIGRLGESGYLGVSFVAWLELALTVATTLVAGAATAVAYCLDRRLRTNAATGAEDAPMQYTARAGLLASGTFTLVILFESIPILYYWNRC